MYVLSPVLQYKHDLTTNQSVSRVECKAKNPDSTRITVLDNVDCNWISQDDTLLSDIRTKKIKLTNKTTTLAIFAVTVLLAGTLAGSIGLIPIS